MSEINNEVAVDATVEAPAEDAKVEVAVEATPAPAVEEVKEAQAVVEVPAVEETEGKGLGTVKGGAIGSTVVKGKKKVEIPKAEPVAQVNTVALYSKKNYHWAENGGALKSGYNIVDKAKADNWLTLAGVRLATPEEVATAFGAGN